MPRVALILPTASYRARDFVPAAGRLGLDLTVVSDRPQLLSEGAEFLLTDCRRPEAAAEDIVNFARTHPLDAIVAPDDEGVLTAALAAERLGLPHNPPAAVAATRNKVALRRALRHRARQPRYQVADVLGDPGERAEQLGFPVVLKPVSLSGSRGVIRANDEAEARAAADRIRLILTRAGRNPNEPILIERFVPGVEVAVEGVVDDGELDILAVFDKPDAPDGPYFEETIYVTPSRLHPEVLAGVRKETEAAVAALGLVRGPVHAELRIDRGLPVVIEVAARPIGGLCGRALHFGLLGTTLEELLLESALGLTTRIARRSSGSSGVLMIPIPRSGVLTEVAGIERVRGMPGITGVELTAPVGSPIEALPDGDRYLGFVFAEADDPATTEELLRSAQAELDVRIDG